MPSFRNAIVLSLGLSGAAVFAQAQENVMVVFDGSNSMWGQIDGTAKIEIARGVMENLLGGWADDRQVGLMAYGHRKRGDCSDIETLVEPSAGVRAEILERIKDITPRGKTPLTDAVERAATELSYTDQPATVVLISDGLESCDRDPCALAAALEKGGVGFTAHVVGFGLGSDQDAASLSCIAEETGGIFVQASNANELEQAFGSVSAAVAVTPEPAVEPEPEAEPEPEPEPTAPKVTVTGPNIAIGGSTITVTWDPTVSEADYITVVPVGTKDGEFGPYAQIRKNTEVAITVPSREGLYEIRYQPESGPALGMAPLEITKANVVLTAPESVVTGSDFAVGWTPTVNKNDYVTIVPAGAAENTFGSYLTVRDKSDGSLTAAADPGLYELRYVLNVDGTTVASLPIEVSEPEATLTVPDTAIGGAKFPVSWTGKVNRDDYVTIVPIGTAEGEFGNYIVVRNNTEGELQAPAETGLYEVRYVLREGSKTIARASIEITKPEVTISAPAAALAGEKFAVSWTGTVNTNDYITIVPAGAPEGEYGNYLVVRTVTEKDLQGPAETGMYEVRYVLREGNKTMASVPIEITEPEVSVRVPETARTGERFIVSWTGQVSTEDYITIVPVGAPEGEFGNYFVVRKHDEKDLRAPSETGLYEVRYLLREGNKTMASAMIEIVEPDVIVSGPTEVRAGDTMTVSWTGTVNIEDYIALVPMGSPDDDFSNYFIIRKQTERDMTAPETTGMYELRYVLKQDSKVLARMPIEVVSEHATLNTGAAIEAPDSAAAGSQIEVNWLVDADSADQRIALASPDQAIFTWITAVKISGQSQVQITLPEAPGTYEFRFLDISNQAVLARKIITVE